jgi:hypothetical protein
MEHTPEKITELKENEVFVFGSNTDGIHGAGAAKTALDKFGAIYGQPRGLQGQSYAIVTKDLETGNRSIRLETIAREVDRLMLFAYKNPHLKFYVTKIGTDLAGYSIPEMRIIFVAIEDLMPDNVITPKEFKFNT